jgi:isopentenyl-diphosphate delta-isomerase
VALRSTGRQDHGLTLTHEERVVLVDADDHEIGTAEKLRAHQTGELHRALSVFVFDGTGRVLIQRRAVGKYHSPGKWSNTCCGHPRPHEGSREAAERRLREEMGVTCTLRPAGRFVYRADLGNGLVEHELDHLFVGEFNGDPVPNSEEVDEWAWTPIAELRSDCATRPDRYTVWLPLALASLEGSPAE